MRLNIHHYIEPSPQVLARLDAIMEKLDRMERCIMSALDDLASDVAAEDTVIDGAVTLINGFAAQLAAAGTDPTKLAALSADIKAKTAELSAAVLANTPTPVVSSPPVTEAAASSAAKSAVAGS